MTVRPRRFTGWHMTAILVAFFGVVIAVNLIMARMAIGTFGGTVVDNSYVASQRYNGWLNQAREQQRLGWTVAARLDGGRHLVVATRGPDGARFDAHVSAMVRHPLGQTPATPMLFAPDHSGHARSRKALPPGRWQVDLIIAHGEAVHRSIVDLK